MNFQKYRTLKLALLASMLALILSCGLVARIAHAEDTSPGTTLQNPLTSSSIDQLLASVLSAFVKLSAPVIVIAIIYSGFLLVTARGDTAKIKQGKSALLWTVVGAAVIIGAQLLATAIQNTINGI